MARKLLSEMFGVGLVEMPAVNGQIKPPAPRVEAGAEPGASAGSSGLRVSGDKETMEVLIQVMRYSDSANEGGDVGEWVDDSIRALQAGTKSGTATLPAFKTTPGLDSFNDDQGSGPEEEY